jgi:hypothetical protein
MSLATLQKRKRYAQRDETAGRVGSRAERGASNRYQQRYDEPDRGASDAEVARRTTTSVD